MAKLLCCEMAGMVVQTASGMLSATVAVRTRRVDDDDKRIDDDNEYSSILGRRCFAGFARSYSS